MKTTATFLGQLLIILLLPFAAKGQILEYKELKEFHQDTIAYIEYTFTTSNHFLHCTMDGIFSQCEIPFKSYMLARTTRDGIGFCILFFQDAEKVRALLQAGKPIWSVHCNFPTIYNNEIASYIAIYKELTKLPTNKIMVLDKIAKDILRKRNIEWVRYRDNKGMLKMYNTK